MKRDVLDGLFSLYIRHRDNWTCQRCHKKYPEKHQGLHCMHLVKGRGNKRTRFDEENCAAGCYGCHRYLDTHPAEKREWYWNTYGREQYFRVQERARTGPMPDEDALKEKYRAWKRTL